MVFRIESPNSINTFKQCPRKYFYSYKAQLPRKDSIHTIAGKAVHETLEYLFQIKGVDETNFELDIQHKLIEFFNKNWVNYIPKLIQLDTDKETIRNFYDGCLIMINNFLVSFIEKLNQEINNNSFKEAFEKLKPKTEVYLKSEALNVHGFVDAIHEDNNEITIIDYKTGSKDEITEEYRLQLAIYSLVYKENFNKTPKKVGISFLKHCSEKFIEVDEDFLNLAKKECKEIQTKNISNDIKDYPKNPGPLCKWRTGQCDFYNLCFGQQKLDNFIQIEEKKGL